MTSVSYASDYFILKRGVSHIYFISLGDECVLCSSPSEMRTRGTMPRQIGIKKKSRQDYLFRV